MIGTTLLEIGDHIESLASETGEYSLVCARYGDRPVPAAGLRFESRPVARAAARATEQYRDALRRYDPRLPYYDVIVRQEFADDATATGSDGDGHGPNGSDDRHDVRRFSAAEAVEWTLSDPAVEGRERSGDRGDRAGPGDRGRDRVEFCHETAAAVFEALSAGGHGDAESAVMDAYFELAERVTDPDDLCLCLLEAMAEALRQRLTPDEQAAVLSAAAAGLQPVSDGGPAAAGDSDTPAADSGASADPVADAFDRLARAGVVDGYVRESGSGDEGTTVRVTDYAFAPRDGRVPTLPLVLELYRRAEPGSRPDAVRVEPADGGWRVDLAAGSDEGPIGLVNAAIRT